MYLNYKNPCTRRLDSVKNQYQKTINKVVNMLKKFIFNFSEGIRYHNGSRNVTHEPRTSPRIISMSQNECVRKKKSLSFSISPMLVKIPSLFYASSASYLVSSLQSVRKRNLSYVMKRPMPILATILANKYCSGIYEQIIKMEKYPAIIFHILLIIMGNNIAMTWNYAVCLGFNIWYASLPSQMIAQGCYDLYDLLNPEIVREFKSSIIMQDKISHLTEDVIKPFVWDPLGIIADKKPLVWDPLGIIADKKPLVWDPLGIIADKKPLVWEPLGNSIIADKKPFVWDPLGISVENKQMEELNPIHNRILKKRFFSCLTVCVINILSCTGIYTGFYKTDI